MKCAAGLSAARALHHMLPAALSNNQRSGSAEGCAHGRMQVNDEASMKVLEVEMEYNRRRKPVYEKRARLITDIEQFWLHVFMQVHTPFLTLVCALNSDDAVSAASTGLMQSVLRQVG